MLLVTTTLVVPSHGSSGGKSTVSKLHLPLPGAICANMDETRLLSGAGA